VNRGPKLVLSSIFGDKNKRGTDTSFGEKKHAILINILRSKEGKSNQKDMPNRRKYLLLDLYERREA